MTSPAREHEEAAAAKRRPVRCAVLTVSDTRTADTDVSGPLAARLLEERGHQVVRRGMVPDEPDRICHALEALIADAAIDAVITTGGTGLGRRDRTVEVVRGLLTTELEGFGELFRMLSWEQVRANALMSRAVGGLVSRAAQDGGDTFIFALPGSSKAVELGVRELVAPQLAHLVWLRRSE